MLICFEGMPASGKTTQLKLIEKRFKKERKDVVVTKSLNNRILPAINNFISAVKMQNHPTAIMFLLQTANALHYKETINALEQDKIVLTDRWDETFYSYQKHFGILKKQPEELLKSINRITYKKLLPDINIIIDVDEKTAYDRYKKRIKSQTILPIFDESFFAITRKHYIKVAEQNEWVIINGNKSVYDVNKDIWQVLLTKIAP
jgi:dTMP kinase